MDKGIVRRRDQKKAGIENARRKLCEVSLDSWKM